jgi:hypothetical protein
MGPSGLSHRLPCPISSYRTQNADKLQSKNACFTGGINHLGPILLNRISALLLGVATFVLQHQESRCGVVAMSA